MKPGHRPRDDPYPDELDELFCEEDQTLCSPGRLCLCCVVAELEQLEEAVTR